MNGLYIVSTEEYSGKSTIALSLALNLKEKKKKVAYMKPIGTIPTKVNGYDSCEDVEYIWKELGKPGDVGNVCPISLMSHFKDKAFAKEKTNYLESIKSRAKKLVSDYNFLILEGAGNINQGTFINASAKTISNLLDVPTLLIAKYRDALTLDEILVASKELEPHFLGVIINMVPESEIETISKIIKPALEKNNIKFLGYIIKDRILASVSVAKVAEHLNGRILAGKNHLDKMVESFMVGAMGQEQAISFFRRKANKAVITGGDRSDVQLAALETPTNALILTGNLSPRPLVISKAEEREVPVILVGDDTLDTVEKTESLLSHTRIRENQKIQHMEDLLNHYIDLNSIYASLEK